MKKILVIIAHNLRLIAADRSTLFWLLAMPIAFTFVLGLAFSGGGGGGGSTDPVRYGLTVANLDRGPQGEALLAAIEAAGKIDLLPIDGADAGDTALELVQKGDRSAALVIPPDYSERLARRERVTLTFHRNPERMNPYVTRQAIDEVLTRLRAEGTAGIGARTAYAELRGEPPPELAERLSSRASAYVAENWDPPSVTVAAERLGRTAGSDVPSMGFNHSSPAMALMYVLLNGLMMSIALVDERRERTLARLFTTPVARSSIIVANLGWRFVIGMLQMWILIAFGGLALGVDWGDSPVGLVLVTVTYVAAVAGLSVLLGSISRSSRQAQSAALVLSLTMCALGGLWWPLEITPKLYQAAGHAVPTGWAMDAMHNLVSRGYSLAGVAPQALVLALFAIGFTVAATLTFRHE